jgi:hypothetical protein
MKKVDFGGKKKVQFGANRPSEPPPPTIEIDNWVESRNPKATEPMKRLTIDVPLSLHKRIKSQCALQNLVMADEIRTLLETRFPDPNQAAPVPHEPS